MPWPHAALGSLQPTAEPAVSCYSRKELSRDARTLRPASSRGLRAQRVVRYIVREVSVPKREVFGKSIDRENGDESVIDEGGERANRD